jgi:hypothetical protein
VSLSGPYFHAWCDDADRIDAFAAAASALFHSQTCEDGLSVDALVSKVRASFAATTSVSTGGCAKLSSGNRVNYDLESYRDGHKGWFSGGPLKLAPYERRDLLVESLEIAISADVRSMEVEAAILSILTQQDVADFLMYLCAPDARAGVTTGSCSWAYNGGAPVQACMTYHADAALVARDLALSWVHLHDGDKMQQAAGMSMAALKERVDSAPHGASVDVAGDADLVRSALGRSERHAIPVRLSSVRGADIAFKGASELTRENVLRALSTPPAALLDALEASAFPDDEWRAVEALALETIEAKQNGVPTYKVWVNSRKHLQFIQRHAPYHVRRLPNGGVLLATHPYRTLWQLYADALFLLGITP